MQVQGGIEERRAFTKSDGIWPLLVVIILGLVFVGFCLTVAFHRGSTYKLPDTRQQTVTQSLNTSVATVCLQIHPVAAQPTAQLRHECIAAAFVCGYYQMSLDAQDCMMAKLTDPKAEVSWPDRKFFADFLPKHYQL